MRSRAVAIVGLPPRLILRGREGFERKRMDARAHRVAQCVVNELMPFDETLAVEAIADDQRFEMVAAAGSVADLDDRAGQARLDHALQFVRIHPRYDSVPLAPKSTWGAG